MARELFKPKKRLKKVKSRLESALSRYDRFSFKERLDRLRFLNEIYPRGLIFSADPETIFIFDELKNVYVSGGLISTIILSQALIERKLQIHFNHEGLGSVAKRGLKEMLSYGKKHGLINNYFFDRIDKLRRNRNPFMHLHPWNHEFTTTQRFIKNAKKGKFARQPYDLLFDDAKESIRLAYAVFINDLK